MAVDKLVDSTQLDADLTSVANAIRTKGGTSADLAFPAGFVSAVQAIPSGGGGIPTANFVDFMEGDSTTLDFSGVTKLRAGAIDGVVMTSAFFPDCLTITAYTGRYTSIPVLVFPSLQAVPANGFRNADAHLKTLDFGTSMESIGGTSFYGASVLDVIILRRTSGVARLAGTNCFTNTPFASGKSGGTIYIPKALYDHLGDGTSLDYKAATNWSTVNGYGTITWSKIEGSQYENYYADGTPIT